jgi:hypothetical protein
MIVDVCCGGHHVWCGTHDQFMAFARGGYCFGGGSRWWTALEGKMRQVRPGGERTVSLSQ